MLESAFWSSYPTFLSSAHSLGIYVLLRIVGNIREKEFCSTLEMKGSYVLGAMAL